MKIKIQAGAELETLSPGELRDELTRARAAWISEVSRGVRARRFSATGTSDAGGAITIGVVGDGVGPDTGMVWLLRRFSVQGYNPAGTDTLALYNGSTSGSAVIVPKLQTWQTDMDEFLMPGDRLVVAGTVAINTQVWITGQVQEAPASLLWRMM